MRLCLVEDNAAVDLEPLSLTRPVFDLRLGAGTLKEKIERAFGGVADTSVSGALVRRDLADVTSERHPGFAVNDPGWLGAGRTLVVNGRWVPQPDFVPPGGRPPWVLTCQGKAACALVEPEQAARLGADRVGPWFEEVASLADGLEVGGEWINRPWDLVSKNADHLARDYALEGRGRVGLSNRPLKGVAVVGPADSLSLHETARIDPYTVFDTTGGPITVEAGAVVQPFTRIEGPCYIGHDTQLFRANIRGGVTIGPNCRVGGEVEQSILHGHSNKYHEGFLGHAYVGEWVNLGAITSNSDLRNDYGEVHVPLRGDPVATGMAKVGCFIGDHTRTGLGSLLNTGTAVGVMCNLLPAGPLLPKHVPSFAAVLYGRVAQGFPLEQAFATARVVMARRGRVFTDPEEQLYRQLYERTRLERQRAFHKTRDRRGDSWPVSAAGF